MVDGYAHIPNATEEEKKKSLGNMTIGENYYYGGLLRFDMSPKPSYMKIKELIQKRWHTEEKMFSNDRGVAAFRGFYGDYDIEIITPSKTVKKEIKLSDDSDKKIKVVL